MNLICGECGLRAAEICCMCSDPPCLLCPMDKEKHLDERKPQRKLFHFIGPLSAMLLTKEALNKKRIDFFRLGIREDTLKEAVDSIEQQNEAITTAYERLQARLAQRKKEYLKELKECQAHAATLLERAMERVSIHSLEEDYLPTDGFERLLMNENMQFSELFTLIVTESIERLEEALQVLLESQDEELRKHFAWSQAVKPSREHLATFLYAY